MATVKSSIITQLDTGLWPGSAKDVNTPAGIVAAHSAKTTSGDGSATNDLFRMLRLWSGWIMPHLWFETAAWGASGSIDIGFYDITATSSGAIIGSGNQIASGLDVSSAVAFRDVRILNGTPDKRPGTIGEQLSLTTDKYVDLVVKAAHIGASQAAKFSFVAGFSRR